MVGWQCGNLAKLVLTLRIPFLTNSRLFGHKRHFVQHVKGGSEVVTIVSVDSEGTRLAHIIYTVAFLLVYLEALATAALQLLQLPSDLLLRKCRQLPVLKGTSTSCRSPTQPVTSGGLEVLRAQRRFHFTSAASRVSLWFVCPCSPPLRVHLSFLTACHAHRILGHSTGFQRNRLTKTVGPASRTMLVNFL